MSLLNDPGVQYVKVNGKVVWQKPRGGVMEHRFDSSRFRARLMWLTLAVLLLLSALAPMLVPAAISLRILVPCHEVERCAKEHGIPYRPRGNEGKE